MERAVIKFWFSCSRMVDFDKINMYISIKAHFENFPHPVLRVNNIECAHFQKYSLSKFGFLGYIYQFVYSEYK